MDIKPHLADPNQVYIRPDTPSDSERLRKSLGRSIFRSPRLVLDYMVLTDYERFEDSSPLTLTLSRQHLGHVAGKALELYGGSPNTEDVAFATQFVDFFKEHPHVDQQAPQAQRFVVDGGLL